MSYATLDDMVTRFGADALSRLAEPDDEQSFDAAKVQAALDDATSVINAYAAGRYAVPLNPIPAPVRRWCADMARYYLAVALDSVTESVRKAFEDAMKGLTDMQKGVVVFQADGVPAPEKPTGGGVAFSGPQRVFTAHGLRGF